MTTYIVLYSPMACAAYANVGAFSPQNKQIYHYNSFSFREALIYNLLNQSAISFQLVLRSTDSKRKNCHFCCIAR